LVGSYEGKIGEVTVVEFDFDLVHFGELTGGIDPADVIVDSDHMGASEGQTHGVVAKSDAQLQDFLALRGGEKPQYVVTREVRPPGHGVEGEFGSTGERT
jgi:hypothetical protein